MQTWEQSLIDLANAEIKMGGGARCFLSSRPKPFDWRTFLLGFYVVAVVMVFLALQAIAISADRLSFSVFWLITAGVVILFLFWLGLKMRCDLFLPRGVSIGNDGLVLVNGGVPKTIRWDEVKHIRECVRSESDSHIDTYFVYLKNGGYHNLGICLDLGVPHAAIGMLKAETAQRGIAWEEH